MQSVYGNHNDDLAVGNTTPNGYLYIYTTNEALSDVNVFFDDLKITHIEPYPIVQADDYYPFGLTLAGTAYERLGSQQNRFKYNGKELQDDLGLDWYDYGARMYDAAVGRWWVVDPLSEKWNQNSPYYAGNNPILFVDYDGEDYGISIDHEKKTITFEANIVSPPENPTV